MKRLIDLSTDEEFAELAEILAKAREGHSVGTMKQVVQNVGTEGYRYVDLQQNTSESSTILQVNGDYFYVTIQRQTRIDVRKFRTMWNTVLQRGTLQFTKGLPNDYIFVLEVGKSEMDKGYVYCVSAVQPIFVTSDGDMDLTFVFPLENVSCAKEEISVYDVEYEASMREESGNSAYAFDFDEDEDEPENFEENEEVLKTDEFTEV